MNKSNNVASSPLVDALTFQISMEGGCRYKYSVYTCATLNVSVVMIYVSFFGRMMQISQFMFLNHEEFFRIHDDCLGFMIYGFRSQFSLVGLYKCEWLDGVATGPVSAVTAMLWLW